MNRERERSPRDDGRDKDEYKRNKRRYDDYEREWSYRDLPISKSYRYGYDDYYDYPPLRGSRYGRSSRLWNDDYYRTPHYPAYPDMRASWMSNSLYGSGAYGPGYGNCGCPQCYGVTPVPVPLVNPMAYSGAWAGPPVPPGPGYYGYGPGYAPAYGPGYGPAPGPGPLAYSPLAYSGVFY